MDGLQVAVNVAVVGIGADDAAMRWVVECLGAVGHRVIGKHQLAAGAPLLEVLTDFIEDPEVDVVVAIANDPDPVRAAMAPMVSRPLPGFGELLRAAAFSEIGSSAMLIDGEAARCGDTYVFVVPGTVGAAKVALEHLLIPQLDIRTRPTNLASKLPRLRAAAPPADAFRKRESTEPGTPPPPTKTAVAPTKTAPPAETVRPPAPTAIKTPPMGVVLRATPVEPDAASDAEMIRSDAAILIPPAEIVPDEPAPVAASPEPPAHPDTVAAEQLGEFVKSLEQHAHKLRAEKSQVGPLPVAPVAPVKTQPPPIKRKTDAEKKADRDASVTDAISKVEPLPAPPPPSPEPAAPRKKNETTPQQWAKAAEDLEKISPRAARDPGSLGPASSVLASGDRVIVIPQHRKRRMWLWVPLALVVGAGGAFVVKTQFLSGNRTASAEPTPEAQVVKVESVEALPTPPSAPQAPVAMPAPLPPEQPQEIEMEAGSAQPGNLTALAQARVHHGSAASAPARAPVETGSAAGSAGGSAEAPDPRTHPNVAPASPDCDEASCILERYKRECCARYKPAEMPVEAIAPAGPPETLDKAAVKAGIAEVRPAIQQCGEDHYAKGTVKITLTVTADGKVTDSTVAESPAPELGSCVAKVLERATFGKTQNGAVFTYPFMF